jgi:DNA-directed RNA polymerase subunit RPC12/RpoP
VLAKGKAGCQLTDGRLPPRPLHFIQIDEARSWFRSEAVGGNARPIEEDQVQGDHSSMEETSEFHAACAVLGLSTAPSLSEARAAFRVRAALLHPDVHQSAGTHRMNAATAAMQQLSDAHRLVVESLLAGAPDPTNVTEGHDGMTRRCTKCRREFQYTTNDALIACPRCGQELRVISRNRRSYSRGRLRAGRVAVYSRSLRTPQRTEPLGRLAHIVLWHND